MSQNKKEENEISDYPYRQFSTADIKKFRENLETVIIAPYNEKQVKGVGYNLTASNMIYSLSKHKLLTVYDYKDGSYFKLKPHDTALILSHEYFQLDSNVAGNFYSRVRRVSEGLGHISTTLDPNWKGMFLIAVNNTTNRTLKVQLCSVFEGKEEKNEIATVILKGINSGETAQNTNLDNLNLDNPAMRIDILKELTREPSRIWHASGYNKFKALVNALDSFEPVETEITSDINKIKGILIDIRNHLMYENNIDKTKSSISALDWFSFDKDEELKNKINDLKKYLENDNYRLYTKKDEVNKQISLLKKECDYILLCEKVNQIHELIDSYVHYHHKLEKTKEFILKATENITSIFFFAGLLIIIYILINNTLNAPKFDSTDLYVPTAVALVTAFVNIIIKKLMN